MQNTYVSGFEDSKIRYVCVQTIHVCEHVFSRHFQKTINPSRDQMVPLSLAALLSTASGCNKDGCPFSYSSIPGLVCGEVDAAPRMPSDIWEDQTAVNEYVAATIALYHVDGAKLVQESCDHSWNHTQLGNVTWAPQNLMQETCLELCRCIYPETCKDVPDDPKNHRFCSLCGPKFNAPMPVEQYCIADLICKPGN